MLTHQNNTDGLATVRTKPAGTTSRSELARRLSAADTDAFMAAIRAIARRLMFSTPTACKSDRDFLQEIAREEQRVQMKQWQRLLTIAGQSTRPEDKVAVMDLVRQHVETQRECLDVVIASDEETRCQGAADIDARMFEHRRDRPSKERALASLRRHFAALRMLIDSIEAHPVR